MGNEWGYDCLPSSCGEVDYLGQCDGADLSWCRYSGLSQQNCADQSLDCVWRDDEAGYACDDCFQCDGVCTDLDTSVQAEQNFDNLFIKDFLPYSSKFINLW